MSRDLVVRSAAFQASYMTAAGVAGRMGAAQLAAHQIGLQLWELVALLLDSFAIAAMSLIGASLGGGDVVGARRTAWTSTRYGLVAGAVFAVLVGAGWWLIPQAFTSSRDVQHQAHLLWPWLVAMMPVGGVLFALDGVLLGAGDNAYIRTVTVVGRCLRLHPDHVVRAALRLGHRGSVGRARVVHRGCGWSACCGGLGGARGSSSGRAALDRTRSGA